MRARSRISPWLGTATVLLASWLPAFGQRMPDPVLQQCSPRERIELRKERYDKAEIDKLCRGSNRNDGSVHSSTSRARYCITPAGSCRDPASPPGGSCACFTPAGVFLGAAR